MKNLIFFDIDGTIISEDNNTHIIPNSTIETIHMLQSNGNLCFINSGRAISEINDTILNLGMDGLVCGCGTYISYKNEVLFHKTIPHKLGNEILTELESCRLEWLLEGKNFVHYNTKEYKTRIRNFKSEHIKLMPNNCRFINPQKAHNITFDKFCVCISDDSDFDTFKIKFNDCFMFIDRGGGFFEIVPHGYSKATGIQFLMDYFDIALDHTFAIGDSTNDLPMLEYAGTGIVMGGSSPDVIKCADYITDTVLNNGIYNAMKHFNLI